MKPDEDPAGDSAGPGEAPGRRPLGRLWTDTVADARATVDAELALVRAETSGNLQALRWSVARIGLGMLLLMTALVLATVAVAMWLTKTIGTAPTLLLLAGAYLVVGAWLVRSGSAGVSLRRILPMASIARLTRRPVAVDPAAEGEDDGR